MKKSLIFVLLFTIVSCSSRKEIAYLQDIDDYVDIPFSNIEYTIQPNDILKIDIRTPNFESEEDIYNITSRSQNVNLETLRLDSYLVSADYTVKHKILGKIYVKDKTTTQLEKDISDLLEKSGQLKNPTVNVRVINAKFTILGEVNRPGTYNFSEARITIIQAIGYAGDLRINGRRDNILIVRQEDGKQITKRIDLTSASFIESPFFFVKQNDVIYVEANGPRTKSAGYIGSFGSALAIISATVSTGLLIYNVFFNN